LLDAEHTIGEGLNDPCLVEALMHVLEEQHAKEVDPLWVSNCAMKGAILRLVKAFWIK
jgi:hypothetical protein